MLCVITADGAVRRRFRLKDQSLAGDAADVRAPPRVILLPQHRRRERHDNDALAVLELIDRRRHAVACARNKSIEIVSRALQMFLERAAEEDLCAINLNQTVSDNLIYAL